MRYVLCVALLLTGTASFADMAEHAHRAKAAGIDVVTYRTTVKDVVVIVGAIPAGDAMAGSGNIAIPTLSGMMLDRGTKTLDKFTIAEKLNNVGAQLTFDVGAQSLEVRAKCLRKDLPLVMGLIAAELRAPALAPAEFNKAKQEFIGALQASAQNTGARSEEAFARAVFPEGHPNRPHTWKEFAAAAKAASLDELKTFQAKYYGPAHFTLVLAGDVADEEVRAEVGKAFAGWSGGEDYVRPAAPAAAGATATVSVPLAEKPSVSVILGQASGLRYQDGDSLPLRVGTAILGHGFTGRLMSTVRDKEGLTYNIGAGVSDDTIADGSWDISATFAPALLEKGLASTRRELQKWWSEGVTEEELSARKEGMLGSYFVGMSTTGGIANQILVNVQRGYEVAWLDEYPKALSAVTRTQVNAAIKAHLDPAKMALIEAGSVPHSH
jgi:zinc protease